MLTIINAIINGPLHICVKYFDHINGFLVSCVAVYDYLLYIVCFINIDTI